MSQKAELVAEIVEEKHQVVWNVPSISLAGEPFLCDRTLQIEVSQSSPFESKWLAALRLCRKGYLEITLTLLEQSNPSQLILAKGEFSLSITEQLTSGLLAVQTKMWMPLMTNHVLVIQTKTNSFKFWKRMELGFGFIWLKLTLHLRGTKLSTNDPNEYAVTKFINSSNESFKQSLALLGTEGKLADLKILCSDGVQLMVHRAILSVRNAVFETMLRVDMSEKTTGVIEVDDVSGATMQILLHYWYTGELLDKWKEPELIHEFIYSAGKYQLVEVLELLDNVLGTEKVSTCDLEMLGLVNKLELKNADKRIAEKLRKMLSQTQTGLELLQLCNK